MFFVFDLVLLNLLKGQKSIVQGSEFVTTIIVALIQGHK